MLVGMSKLHFATCVVVHIQRRYHNSVNSAIPLILMSRYYNRHPFVP